MPRSSQGIRYQILTARVSEILHYVWDPIGVSAVPQARDEYEGYVPQVVKLLLEGEAKEKIAKHLYRIEGERMGLTVGSRPSDHTEEVAGTLIDHYEWLEKQG